MGLGAHLWVRAPTYGSELPLMGLGAHLWGSHGSGVLLLGLRLPLMGLGAHLWGSHGPEDPTYGSEDPSYGAAMGLGSSFWV